MTENLQNNRLTRQFAMLAVLILLSLLAGFSQIKTEGLSWQETHYLPRLEAVVAGEAASPWQYRPLTNHLVLWACRGAEIIGLPRATGVTFVAIRVAQNFALFLLAFLLYRRLGIGAYAAILGLMALTWGMTQANYGTDLAFDAYTDILCYLLAALLLLARRFGWLVPLTALAALNRETSGLIPVMVVASGTTLRPRLGIDRAFAGPAGMALAIYVLIVGGLRLWYGSQPWVGWEAGASVPFGFLKYNLTHHIAWGHTAGVLGIVPLLALACYRVWHPDLRAWFWAVVPAWALLHLFLAPLDESRVVLLPQVLVFIPGMLCGIQYLRTAENAGPRGLLV